MGKSNNLYNKYKKNYQNEKDLKNFFKEDEIQTLKNVNNIFANKIIKDLSNFIKNRVELFSYSIKVESCDNNEEVVKNFNHINIIEILPYKSQSLIVLSSNFLSIITDLLFGGHGNFIDKVNKNTHTTFTDVFINQKIIKLIISAVCDVYKKFFSLEVNCFHINKVADLKQSNFNFSQLFLINCFNLSINKIEVCFSILIPLSTINKFSNKESSLRSNIKNKHVKNNVSFEDIYNVELDIIAKIIDISIACDKFYNLSVGDILPIKNPDKITAFIEKKPLFIADYKRFNEQSIIFVEEFINNNLESN